MTDLTNVNRVVIVDGLGRKLETIDAKEIDIFTHQDTLHITHDGDSMYSTGGTQRWLS
jgi:hypothetical protein